MYKGFTYRIYPSKAQEKRLTSVLETCRRWYNLCLEERKTAYTERQEQVSKFAQLAKVKEYRATNPWAAEVQSHVLQVVVADLDKAFQGFFRRLKAGQTPGYPRFKGRNRFSSFGYKEYGNGFKVDGRRLRLSGIGRVAVRWHRPMFGQIKTLRVVRRIDGWYASFTCDVDPQPLPPIGREVGVDVGISSLVTLSTGERINNPRWFHHGQRKLRVLQRRVSRRKLGGNNRKKAVKQVQRHHRRIVEQRKDHLNKLVHQLITDYDRIAIEHLHIANMVRHPRFAKLIFDAGWGYFVRHLMSKAAEAGRQVCFVEPRNTSKTCSGCGRAFEHLTLKDRWVQCECGVSLDRDHNAAINILKRAGQVRWALSLSLDEFAQETADQ